MKLHPLLLGRTKVPFGQFYGGLCGWEGLGALFHFITDKKHFIWVPIHGYLLEHPKEGLVLVDTGICQEQVHQHREYYHGILRFILDDDEYAQEPEEALPQQLKRLGCSCDDIRTVILTHLHEDHVGALRDLKKAKVVVSQTEWNVRRMKLFGFIPMFYEPSYGMIEQWEKVAFDSGAFHSFDRSQDLFRDGSVMLLPTPGHTPGHLSAVVEMDGYQLLVTGDCLYTLRHLAAKQVQAVRFDKKSGAEQVDSIGRIARLKKLLPGLFLVPGHDHTDYQWKHLVPGLAKGWFTEDERKALADYESRLFGDNWTLGADDLPRFVRGPAGANAGTVSDPMQK
jgi:glyoxylase-like metal-dependent hydrolase (beta-lactamase superfamily II)